MPKAPGDGASITIPFATDVYDLSTVKRAAYAFTGDFAFDFAIEDDEIRVTVQPLGRSDPRWPEFERSFRNAVLDQDLRRQIREETEPMRNAILGYAFSRTGLQDSE